jgi:hypothetical protein
VLKRKPLARTRIKHSRPSGDLFESVAENALDFLETAAKQLEKAPKYSLLNFATAVELLLKARLSLEHWALIVDKPNRAGLVSFEKGEFRSVTTVDAIEGTQGQFLTLHLFISECMHAFSCWVSLPCYRRRSFAGPKGHLTIIRNMGPASVLEAPFRDRTGMSKEGGSCHARQREWKADGDDEIQRVSGAASGSGRRAWRLGGVSL